MRFSEIPAVSGLVSTREALDWPFPGYQGVSAPTRFWFEGTESGFILHIEAVFVKPLVYTARPPKGRVFESDCLELFLRPARTVPAEQSGRNPESGTEHCACSALLQPAPFYFGWEIAPDSCVLDYRAGIGEEGRRCIASGSGTGPLDGSGARSGVEPVCGVLHEIIGDTLISFDYDWKSGAVASSRILQDENLWKLDLAVPWSDFGLEKWPSGETWYFTVNRIDVSSDPGGNPGLGCLHRDCTAPRFHQPDLFRELRIC